MSLDRREVLLSQAAHTVFGALGAAEARVYGQSPDDTFGVVIQQDHDRAQARTLQRFHEIRDGANCVTEYETIVTVQVLAHDLGPR